jgi:hypothetical protein
MTNGQTYLKKSITTTIKTGSTYFLPGEGKHGVRHARLVNSINRRGSLSPHERTNIIALELLQTYGYATNRRAVLR